MNIANVAILDDALGELIREASETQTLLRKVKAVQAEADAALIPAAAERKWENKINSHAVTLRDLYQVARDIFTAA